MATINWNVPKPKNYAQREGWAGAWQGLEQNTDDGKPFIRLRKNFKGGAILIIVASKEGGYQHNYYRTGPKVDKNGRVVRNWFTDTKGTQIHLAANSGLQMSYKEFAEINEVVEIAKARLEGVEQLSLI